MEQFVVIYIIIYKMNEFDISTQVAYHYLVIIALVNSYNQH